MAAKHVLRGSAMDRQRRRSCAFDDLGDVDGVDVVTSTTKSNFCSHRSWATSFDDLFNDGSHLFWLAQ